MSKVGKDDTATEKRLGQERIKKQGELVRMNGSINGDGIQLSYRLRFVLRGGIPGVEMYDVSLPDAFQLTGDERPMQEMFVPKEVWVGAVHQASGRIYCFFKVVLVDPDPMTGGGVIYLASSASVNRLEAVNGY